MKTPWHLWLVGVLSLLWNAGGAYDYVMTRSGNEAYLEQMSAGLPPEQAQNYLTYIDSFPLWVSVLWALGVWGAVAGSILLLMRSRFAVAAFVVSFIGMLGNLVWGLLLSPTPMMADAGGAALLFTGAIVVVSILLIVYARAMARRGVLR